LLRGASGLKSTVAVSEPKSTISGRTLFKFFFVCTVNAPLDIIPKNGIAFTRVLKQFLTIPEMGIVEKENGSDSIRKTIPKHKQEYKVPARTAA